MIVSIAQLNPVVGDLQGNFKKAVNAIDISSKDSPDLIVFPELFLVGYPPRDLLERRDFIEKVQSVINEFLVVSKNYPDTGILLGAPVSTGKNTGKELYNSAILIYNGRIIATRHKSLLPTYDVFDEARYFEPAPEVDVVPFKDEILGISVCEDAWNVPELWVGRKYDYNPIEVLADRGATILINISSSPFHIGKEELRYRIIKNHAQKHGIPFIYVNQTGGNDELIFDGRSMCFDRKGNPIEILPSFEECIKTVDTSRFGSLNLYKPEDKIASLHDALVLGVRDYVRKTGFSKVLLGLSGGIDSAVVCCLAAAAVGKENVFGVTMPSPYSSSGSVNDSRKLAENLGIRFDCLPISNVYNEYISLLRDIFKGTKPDITEENIQARIRGNIVMSISNKFGNLVLSTGNKSEIAVGYCTLYGDMSGGLSVISDVPKTMVYELANYINREREIIPREIIIKPPSAELSPGQLDQDTLPPYDILDKILYYYIDEGYSAEDIIRMGIDSGTVKWVITAVHKNEYKRRQAPVGLKVTTKAFGIGRRMPIAAKYE